MYSVVDLSCFDDQEEIVFTYDAASLGDPTHLDPCPFVDDLDDASASCGSRSTLTEESGAPFVMASLKSVKIPKFINVVTEPVSRSPLPSPVPTLWCMCDLLQELDMSLVECYEILWM